MTPQELLELPVETVQAFVELYASWPAEKAELERRWAFLAEQHRADWADLQPCPQPFAARRAAAWSAIADAITAAPYDDDRLTFSQRRERIARARYLAAAYGLQAALFGVDVADPVNSDLLRSELDRFQAVAERHGWAVTAGTTEEAAA